MRFLIIFYLISISCFSQSKNSTIYKYKYYRTINDKDQSFNQNSNINLNQNDTVLYELKSNQEFAIFEHVEKINNNQHGGIDFSEIIINSIGSYEYNFTDSIIYNTVELNGLLFSIKNDFNYIDWEILDENISIYGYNCKVAIHNNKQTLKDGQVNDYITKVWFSEEIDNKSMPFGLTGLKGGIVKINFNNFAEAILIESEEKNLKLKKKKLGRIISQTEYNNILNNSFKIHDEGVDVD